MRFELTVLGSNSATPLYGRHQTAQVLNHNEILYLIDCGEGTQMQLKRYGFKANRIKYIFISHLHGDHYLGLVGLISSMHLNGRKDDLHVYGNAVLKEIIDIQLKASETFLCYELVFHPIETQNEKEILENEFIRVSIFALNHRIPCLGFRFIEKPRLPKIDIEKVEALAIPKSYYGRLKKGIDFIDQEGNIHHAKDLTYPSPLARSYVFCSDTAPIASYLPFIQHADLLYHEATFLHDMVDRARDTYHTTALEAGQIASKVGAKRLIIGHFSARYKDLMPIFEECRTAFEHVKLAIEGETYVIE